MTPDNAGRTSAADRPLILLCNDDGFYRQEIRILHRRLRALGRTVIVAPDRERSAASMAVTLRQPLRLHRQGPSVWSVDGTPADCIYFALRAVLARRPDLVISGMNPGPNLGQQDVHYSGTVAAAVQAAFLGLPAMAVSMIPDARGGFALPFAASVVRRIAERILADGLPPGLALNVNIPAPRSAACGSPSWAGSSTNPRSSRSGIPATTPITGSGRDTPCTSGTPIPTSRRRTPAGSRSPRSTPT